MAPDASAAGRGAEERLRQIEAVSDVALAHLDVEELLDELLERVRQLLQVDTAAVLLLDPQSSELVATAARGLEEEVRQGVRVPLHRGFAGRIAADREPVVLDRVDATTVVNPLLIAKGIKTMAGVPLLDAGRVVGVLHVGSLEHRIFTDEDVELLQMVADRVTGATGTRLAAIERDAALALQRGLLPAGLPDITGLALAARYVPGGGSVVGGDWYDVFRLNQGWLGVVIGDVSGHGLHAAVIMGRVRSALRAYALESRDPADVLNRLDQKLQHFEAGEMATVLYAVLDPSRTEVQVSCAGHLPPLLVAGADDAARFLELKVDPPLGVRSGVARHNTVVPFPEGSLLTLYTDGLIERRGEMIDEGLDRLRRARGPATAEGACARIMSELVGSSTLEDDVAVLVVHRPVADRHHLELALPAEPASLAEVRTAARQWLSAAGMTADATEELVLAIGEAATNAVEHAYGPDGGEVRVRFLEEDGIVSVTVEDDGAWRSPRGADRGRGTGLMEHFTDELRVDTGPDGTSVLLRRAVSGPA